MKARGALPIILKHMADNHPKEIAGVIPYIAEYGRYDDMWVLLETNFRKPVLELIKEQIIYLDRLWEFNRLKPSQYKSSR